MSEPGHHGGGRGGGRGGRGGGEHRGGRGGGGHRGGHGNQQSAERPKKENILDLGKYMDKRITVKFNGGREGIYNLPQRKEMNCLEAGCKAAELPYDL
jgi:U6 snRNA-associated Sm-like protein LSm7